LAVAFANGANDHFKGVASLHGSGSASQGAARRWSAWTTAAGGLAALAGAGALLGTFSGKGLIPDALAARPAFLGSAATGAALANLLATRLGFPVSTTHLLLGGLLGSGLAAAPDQVDLARLWEAFARPLLFGPLLAVALGGGLHLVLRPLHPAPDHRSRSLDAMHFLSAGAVCFARGMNDTPKIAALLIGGTGLGTDPALVLVAVLMTAGGLRSGRRVADTLAHKITGMNPGQGFAANAATASLVLLGTVHGLPLSTTHVSVGALLGIGVTTRQAKWRTVVPVLSAWVVALPGAALLAALAYFLVSRLPPP
jgi:PiT family inorganic phosphate transporter